MSDIIKWFRQGEQKIALREEYQRQRADIQDLRKVLHKDTSGGQLPERLNCIFTVDNLKRITHSPSGADSRRFIEVMVVSTSKTITGMICDLVGSVSKQSGLMTHELITKYANKLAEIGVYGPYNCVMTCDEYSQLIWSFRYLIDYSQISEDERNEISHMMNQCGGAHGLRRGSWRGVGIYVTNRCKQSFMFGQGAIQYSERRDDELITTFVTANPNASLIDLGDLVLVLGRTKDTLEFHVVGHYWPSVSIANRDAIVFIQTDK